MKAQSQGRIATSPKPRAGIEFQRALFGDSGDYSVEIQTGHPELVALACSNGKISIRQIVRQDIPALRASRIFRNERRLAPQLATLQIEADANFSRRRQPRFLAL
jgi:hypothetical protein